MANLRVDNLTGTGGRNAITGSVYFGNYTNSINDYLELADQADLEFGSGDYTVEFWCLPTRDNAVEEIVNKGYPFQIYRNSKAFTLAVDSNTSSYEINTAFGSGEAGEWHHIAVARSGNTTKCFLNGIEGLSSTANTSIHDSSSKFSIGRYSDSASYKYQGYVSNLRIVKGSALYTANFTPPTEKLTAVAGTVLLCCQDTDDPTQEATGKTITGYGRHNRTGVDLTAGGTVNAPGVLNSTNYPSAASDWSFSNGVATINSSNSGFDSLGNATGLFENGYEYDFVANITAYSSGKFELGQNGAGNVGINLSAVGRMTFRWKYTGNTTTSGVAVYAKDHNGNSNFSCNYLSIKKVDMGKEIKVVPPVGIDEGIVLEGETTFNSPNYMYFPTGDTTQRSRGRAVIFGGVTTTPNYNTSISYYNISNFSSAHDFGDMRAAGGWMTACSSSTRGLAIGAGNGGGGTNVVDYVEIATTGNGKDFGDLTEEKNYYGAASNQTRALRGGGYSVGTDTIDYATIATIGNFVDFGNLTQGRLTHEGGVNSPTRAVWGGGTFYTPSVVLHNIIDYITIATTGNATDFGDMTVNRKAMAAVSSSTRGIWSGGYTPTYQNVKDYITIATTGNATDFGDSLWAGAYKSGTSNGTRGVWSGGRSSPGGNANRTNLIEHVTIATTGDGTDFGDLDVRRDGPGACSDSHGGLS